MRILFVTNMWPDAARPWYGTFIESQARSLIALGVELDTLPIRGYASRWAYLSAARSLARLSASRYDIVHAHYGYSGVVARLDLRAPLVVSYCGDDLLGTPDKTGALTRRSELEAMALRQLAWVCAATITKSRQMELRLPPRCQSRNRVIPNGVDLERFRPVPRTAARRRLGWEGPDPIVLFAGNPSVPGKNFPLAVASVEQAMARIGPVRLKVASGVPPSEIPTMMSAADALLLTSHSEGSPNVVKEAMACELPVVATPVGDVEERLAGVAGCYIRGARPDLLGEALAAALQSGRTPQARRTVAALSTSAVAEKIIGVYEDVLAERGRARAGLAAEPARGRY